MTVESTAETQQPARLKSMGRQPLDLRLLPAASAAWATALTVVYSSAVISLSLGMVLTATTVLLAAALLLLGRESSRPLRIRGPALHLLLCAGLSAGVAFSAALTQYDHQQSGWNEAIASDAPVEVSLRVNADAQPLQRPQLDGQPGTRAQAVVDSFRTPGQQHAVPARADVVVIHTLTEDTEPLRAGYRYQALVSATPTGPGERATAVLYPFGSQDLTELPADRWTQSAEIFNGLRAATVQASSHAVGEAPALLPGVILGDRAGQSAELTEAMRLSGLTHMTVVSGTHCALVMGALLGLLRMCRLPRWTGPPVLLAGLVLFVMLVQPAPSVIRAAVMGAIGALAVFAGRGRASSALLCLCVILLLVYDPYYATEAAFQLSVAATIGIVLIGARLREIFERWMPRLIAGPLALAVSAQLFVTPVLLPIAEGITLYSIPANIFAGPLLPLATVPGTLAALLSTSLPWFSVALLWLAGLPAAGIALIGYAAAALPQALAPWPDGWPGWVLAALYLAAAIALCRVIIQGRRRPRAGETLLLGSACGGLAAVVVPLGLLLGGFTAPGIPPDWRFALCDVGQGDMLVLRTAERAGLVVDTGEEPGPAEDCLQLLGIEEVQQLMITHDHRDHYGGTTGVLQAAEVGSILYSGSAGWSVGEAVEDLDGVTLEVQEHRAVPGQTGEHDDGYPLSWQVWSAPDYHANTNNNSLVVNFELWSEQGSVGAVGSANNPLRLLTLGDLEEEIAGLLLNRGAMPQHVDVLKMAHHGAANGGTEILEYTQPEVALIGVGEDNSHGHPAPEIIETLEQLGSAVYRTDLHGTVVFSLAEDGLVPHSPGG